MERYRMDEEPHRRVIVKDISIFYLSPSRLRLKRRLGSDRAHCIRTSMYLAQKSKQKPVDTRATSSLQTGNGR